MSLHQELTRRLGLYKTQIHNHIGATYETRSCRLHESRTQACTYRDLDLAKLVEEDVGRLEVIMDNAACGPIEVGQPIKDLAGNSPGFLLRQHLQAKQSQA